MTTRSIFIKTSFWTLVVLLGLFIGCEVRWSTSFSRLLAIPAFLFVGYANIMFSINFTKILMPRFRAIKSEDLFDKETYTEFKRTLNTSFQIFTTTYISLWLLIFAGCAYWFVTFTAAYRQQQLLKFSQKQRVMIHDVYLKKSLGTQAEFDYYYNNTRYTNRITNNKLQIGDSIDVVFSTNNPDIVSTDGK